MSTAIPPIPTAPKRGPITPQHIVEIHDYIVTHMLHPFSLTNEAKTEAYKIIFSQSFKKRKGEIPYSSITSAEISMEMRTFIMSLVRENDLLATFSFNIRYNGSVGSNHATYNAVVAGLDTISASCGGKFKITNPPIRATAADAARSKPPSKYDSDSDYSISDLSEDELDRDIEGKVAKEEKPTRGAVSHSK